MNYEGREGVCAACGAYVPAVCYAIHRDGFGDGPEVDLCDDCGRKATPTCEELWDMIARRKEEGE